MTYYRTRRRPGPIAALFWLMIALCALIALAEVYPPVTAPLAILLVVAIVWGAIRGAQAKQRAAVARSRPKSTVTSRRWTSKAPLCPHCGGPQKPGASTCQWCQYSLLKADVEERTVRWGA